MADRSTLVARLVLTAKRALNSLPPRQVAVDVAGLHVPDLSRTTAREKKGAGSERVASLLGPSPSDESRRERYQTLREMRDEVPELARAIEVTRGFAFSGLTEVDDSQTSFEIDFSPTARPEVRTIAEGVIERLNLHAEVPAQAIEGRWLGDSMRQAVFDQDLRLVASVYLSPGEVQAMVSPLGQPAEYEVGSSAFGRKSSTVLTPLEVVHYAPNPRSGSVYGRSNYDSARAPFRKLEAVEDVAVILALRRSTGDLFFLWPFAQGGARSTRDAWLRDARQASETEPYFDNTGKLRRRLAAMLETAPRIIPYGTVPGSDSEMKPTVVETSTPNFGQIDALLQFLRNRLFVAIGVPRAFVGDESAVNAKATLEFQGRAFVLDIRDVQKDAARLVAEWINRGLVAQGFHPVKGEYVVRMPVVSIFFSEGEAAVAKIKSESVSSLVSSGVPLRMALEQIFKWAPEVLDRMADEIGRQQRFDALAGASVAEGAISAIVARYVAHEQNKNRRVELDGARVVLP